MIILHCTYRSFNHEIGIMLVIIKSMYLLLCLNIQLCPVITLCSIRTWILAHSSNHLEVESGLWRCIPSYSLPCVMNQARNLLAGYENKEVWLKVLICAIAHIPRMSEDWGNSVRVNFPCFFLFEMSRKELFLPIVRNFLGGNNLFPTRPQRDCGVSILWGAENVNQVLKHPIQL